MEKAKNVLFKVAMIVSIVLFAIWLITGIAMLFIGYSASMADGDPNQRMAMQIIFYVYGGIFIFFSINCFINFFICMDARNNESKGLYVASIIFGALSMIEINIIASIFGFIVMNRKQRRSNVIDY